MPDFTFAELNENTGTLTADGLRNVANVAADAVCSAWSNYAAATSGFPDPSGVGAFNNGLFSRLCEPRGVQAPLPAEEFIGGQCPFSYTVTVGIGSSDPSGIPSTFPPNETLTYFNVPGPIRGGNVLPLPGTDGKQGVVFVGTNQDYPEGRLVVWIDPVSSENGRHDGSFCTVLSVVPTDPNQPDICGNPSPVFPPIVPPTAVFNFPTSVYIGGPFIDVEVSFNPVIFQANALIKPEFNVQVGPFQVVFDAGGVDIFVNPSPTPVETLPPGLDPRPDRPSPKPPSGGGGGDCPDCICEPTDLTEVLEKLDDIIECVCDDDEFENQVFGAAKGGLVTAPTWIRKAVVDVTVMNPRVRSQLGEGTAPDVFFVGWAAFGIGSRLGERIPLSFGANVFTNLSEEVDSFAYSLNFDSVGVCSIEFKKEVP